MHCLKRGQSLDITLLDLDETKAASYIHIKEGVVQVCLVSTINHELFPIGFIGAESMKIEKIRLGEYSLRLEALNRVKFQISPNDGCIKETDSVFNNRWLLILCMIKSSIQIEFRISRLITILIYFFGKRGKENYTLPFELSHSQIALLVGCTRSTVTRQIGLMKEKGLISSDKRNKEILVSERLMEQESIFIEHLQWM